jgi:hypothetical protein
MGYVNDCDWKDFKEGDDDKSDDPEEEGEEEGRVGLL